MKAFRYQVYCALYVLLLCLLIQQKVTAQLHTDFTASPASGCAPVFVHFADNSTGGATSWKWDLGNGTISLLQNPSTTYFNPGKYTIKLVIKKGSFSDSLTKTGFITILALPKPFFKASDTTGCYPLQVNFTDQSIAQEGSITKWEWDLGDGSISSLQFPAHKYLLPGNYNVVVRVTNTAGCISTLSKAQYIKLKDGVKADYTFSGTTKCTPPSVMHFTNESSGTGILSYQWFFGDGNTSLLQNPANTYNTAGLYTIKLIAKNNAGCADTLIKKDSIVVGIAKANFTAPDSACENTSFQVFNTSQPATGNLQWNFSNGSTSITANPVIKYSTAGNYTIGLIADFGSCKDSTSKLIKILQRVKASFTAVKTNSCKAPFTVQFSGTTQGAIAYKWLFGDSTVSALQNPSHTYLQNGSYTVTLIVTNTNGCTDTLKQADYINVQPADIKLAIFPLSGCVPLTFTPAYTVKSLVAVTNYVWNFGDGVTAATASPAHVYTVPGSYTISVTYTTADGCTGTIIYNNAVLAGQKPHVAFSASPVNTCASTPVVFSDHTTGAVTGWLWNFGDGITDSGSSPVHLYNDTGYFNVQLIASNNGCSDTIKKLNQVYIRPPVAKFAVNTACSDPLHFAFTNYSIGADTYNWNFGDGLSSAAVNPVHDYISKGSYRVTLTVTNGGCTHTAAYNAKIIIEKSDFVASKTVICKGDSVILQPVGFNAANIISYKWLLKDGTDTARSVKIIYTSSGVYSPALVITNSSGCTDTMMKTNYITVNGPTAAFDGTSNTACLKNGGNIKFVDASATDGTHAIKNWEWNFGDGSSQSYQAGPFTHAYVSAGFKSIVLKVTDTQGCTDAISKSNQIFIADPRAVFSSNDSMSCQNKPVSFINTSSGEPLQYAWGFGDATGSADASPVHNYAAINTYDAWLKVTDNNGCTDSVYKPAYIHIESPKAIFFLSDSASTCPPLVVSFTNKSKYYKQLSWDFGDGTGTLTDNPVHYYNYPGTYYAKLVVVSPGGCADTLYKKIDIKGPTGNFVYDKTAVCNPGTISFTAQTQNTRSFIWDFNDGSTMNTIDSAVSHLYNAPGTYIPKMILQDAKGCKVPIAGKDTISIYGVTARFNSNTRLICDKGIITFTDSSVSNDLITDYQWQMGDGTTESVQNPAHMYTATGTYPVKLIVTTQYGCKDSSGLMRNISVVSSPAVSVKGDSSACAPAIITFTGNVDVADTSSLTWQWNFNNNSTSAVQHPLPVTYQQDGTYNATMQVTNSSGCVTTVIKPIIIHPVPNTDAGNNTAICEKKIATLHATGADMYTWSPGTLLSCATCAITLAVPDSTITYRVTGETLFGCKSGDSVIITVKHPFMLQVGKGDTLCKGESFQLLAKNAEQYDWTPVAGLDNNHSTAPLARPEQTTNYQVIAHDSIGCFYDTGFVKLVVYNFPTINAGPDQTIAVGSSLELKTMPSADATAIRWQPSTGLSCNSCSNPVASPKQTTAYNVIVINEGGCVTRDEVTIFVICNNGNIFLPNTFSPNGNGTNDVFYPRGTGIFSIKSMHIFNRWGEVVYEGTNFKANDASKGWKGTYKDKPAPNDVYVYFVEVVCENNVLLTYSGNIALIR